MRHAACMDTCWSVVNQPQRVGHANHKRSTVGQRASRTRHVLGGRNCSMMPSAQLECGPWCSLLRKKSGCCVTSKRIIKCCTFINAVHQFHKRDVKKKNWILSRIHSSHQGATKDREKREEGCRGGSWRVQHWGVQGGGARGNAAGSAVAATAGDLCNHGVAAASAKKKQKSLKASLQVKVRSLCLQVQFKLHRELCKLLCNELRDAVASRSVLKASTNRSATEDVHSP